MAVPGIFSCTKDVWLISVGGANRSNGKGDFILLGPGDAAGGGTFTGRGNLEFSLAGIAEATAPGTAKLKLRVAEAPCAGHQTGNFVKFLVEEVTGGLVENAVAGNCLWSADGTVWPGRPHSTVNRALYQGSPSNGDDIFIDISAMVEAARLAGKTVLRVRFICADADSSYNENTPSRAVAIRSRHSTSGKPVIVYTPGSVAPTLGAPTEVTPATGPSGEYTVVATRSGIVLPITRFRHAGSVSNPADAVEVETYNDVASDASPGVWDGAGRRWTSHIFPRTSPPPATVLTWSLPGYIGSVIVPLDAGLSRTDLKHRMRAHGTNPVGWSTWTDLEDGRFRLAYKPSVAAGSITVQTNTRTPDIFFSIDSMEPNDYIKEAEVEARVKADGFNVWPASNHFTFAGTTTKRGRVTWRGDTLEAGREYELRVYIWNADGVRSDASEWVSWTPRDAVGPSAMSPRDTSVLLYSEEPVLTIGHDTPFNEYRWQLYSEPGGAGALLHDSGIVAVALGTSVDVTVPAGLLAFGQRPSWLAAVREDGLSEMGPFSLPANLALDTLSTASVVTVLNGFQRNDGVWVTSSLQPSLRGPFNDVDASVYGDLPTLRQWEVWSSPRGGAALHSSVSISALGSDYDVPAGVLTAEGTYEARVRWADGSEQPGQWSEWAVIRHHQDPDVGEGDPPDANDPTPDIAWLPTFYGDAIQDFVDIRILEVVSAEDSQEIYSVRYTGTDTSYTLPPRLLKHDTGYNAVVIVTDTIGGSTELAPQTALTMTGQATSVSSTSAALTLLSALPQEDFSDTVANGWASADVGGAWTLEGTAADFDKAAGVGTINLPIANDTHAATLESVSLQDVTIVTKWRTDKLAVGGVQRFALRFRIIDASNYLMARAEVRNIDNLVRLRLFKVVGGVQTELANVITAITHAAATDLQLKAQATGTTLRAKVWLSADSEPGNWDVTASDSTAALQAPGAIGYHVGLVSTVTNAPVLFTFDDLVTTG